MSVLHTSKEGFVGYAEASAAWTGDQWLVLETPVVTDLGSGSGPSSDAASGSNECTRTAAATAAQPDCTALGDSGTCGDAASDGCMWAEPDCADACAPLTDSSSCGGQAGCEFGGATGSVTGGSRLISMITFQTDAAADQLRIECEWASDQVANPAKRRMVYFFEYCSSPGEWTPITLRFASASHPLTASDDEMKTASGCTAVRLMIRPPRLGVAGDGAAAAPRPFSRARVHVWRLRGHDVGRLPRRLPLGCRAREVGIEMREPG